ncbi:alpha/beta hydrolase [bacterium]|nr:alpha/beta hydrolase [bacterium]
MRQNENVLSDIPYADKSSAQKMDVFVPDGQGPFPAVILVHGGAFMFGDKSSTHVWAKALVASGYLAAAINYRLSGEAIFPANIQDVKAAIRFLRANSERFRVRPDAVGIWGDSAGGYLAALAGTSGGVEELEDLSLGNREFSSRVQAVVDWYGPTNFLEMDEHFQESGKGEPTHSLPDSPESSMLGATITEVPDLVAKANPETYIAPDNPPFLVQHGTEDGIVPVEQSIFFAKKLRTVLGADSVTLDLLDGAGHGGERFESPTNFARVFEFLDRLLRP